MYFVHKYNNCVRLYPICDIRADLLCYNPDYGNAFTQFELIVYSIM